MTEIIEMNEKRLIIPSLLIALSGSVVNVQAQTCTPAAATPYIYSDGAWNITAAAAINTGNQIAFGPQPGSVTVKRASIKLAQ
jgi:endoglucanase